MATTKKPAKSAPKKAAASKTVKKATSEAPAEKIAPKKKTTTAAKTAAAKAPAKRKAKAIEPVEVLEEAVAVPIVEESHQDEQVEVAALLDEGDDTDEAEDSEDTDADAEFEAKPRPPANLVRLQKILASAGVASRRRAEELIEQGRVQVNGKIVTELGTKADAGRDHIRVDGKLLHGAERLRYYVLNKPKGFVTTVKDPEGRPTVMQFFEKMKERLYPVGRLDYMSEGLLLVTNDGELANRLTKASSGVEKTYLVKVAGQPTEDELDTLRAGVSIPRGKDGADRVKTSPARIRQVRQGDNPWFEVVLIEGRNRELRKMFEEIGHFVEKIRRIGYGPLVLDQEPGNLRELDEQELSLLRLAADGKLRTPKSKDVRRRNLMDAQALPTIKPKPSAPAPSRPWEEERAARASRQGYRPSPNRDFDRNPRPSGPGSTSFGKDRGPARPAWKKDAPAFRPAEERDTRPTAGSTYGDRPAAARSFGDRPNKPFGDRPAKPFGDRPSKPYSDRPAEGRPFAGRTDRDASKSFGARPKPFGDRPAKPFGDRPERKSFGKPGGEEKWGKRNVVPQRPDDNYDDLEPRKPVKIFIEPVANDERPSRPTGPRSAGSGPYAGRSSAPRSFDRPQSDRPRPARQDFNRPGSDRPSRPGFSKPGFDRQKPDQRGRSNFDRPRPEGGASDRTSAPRPFRSEGGLERRYTTSSGIPRPGGARPNNKSAKPGSGKPYGSTGSRPAYGAGKPTGGRSSFPRSEGQGSGARPARPFTPRGEGSSEFRPREPKRFPNSAPGADRKGADTWKPKTAGGARPKPGGSSRPGGFKGGSRPGGGRPGGAPGGRKRY